MRIGLSRISLAGCAFLLAVLPFTAWAQQQVSSTDADRADIRQVMRESESHYQKGQQAYSMNEYDRARREFDQAVDCIVVSQLDIRSDPELSLYYRQLIEKINRYQIAAVESNEGGFIEQRHEPSPLDKIASLSDSDLQELKNDEEDVNSSGFNFRFSISEPVKQFVAYFARGRGRSSMEAGLLRSTKYRDAAKRIFREEGVPTDLIWLAQVESGWNPYALSSAAAKGIWQFIPSTGSRFGLQQDYWVDERSNPEKSARAAARYLKFLSNRYHGNWELALAAYNSGEGTVDSAVARTGDRDFWSLHRAGWLPRETRNYVPAILAVVAIAKNPAKYGFEVPPPHPERYETRAIAKQTDLRLLAKKFGVSYTSLLDLNPELQRGVTPPGKRLVRIPASAVQTASDQQGK